MFWLIEDNEQFKDFSCQGFNEVFLEVIPNNASCMHCCIKLLDHALKQIDTVLMRIYCITLYTSNKLLIRTFVCTTSITCCLL